MYIVMLWDYIVMSMHMKEERAHGKSLIIYVIAGYLSIKLYIPFLLPPSWAGCAELEREHEEKTLWLYCCTYADTIIFMVLGYCIQLPPNCKQCNNSQLQLHVSDNWTDHRHMADGKQS